MKSAWVAVDEHRATQSRSFLGQLGDQAEQQKDNEDADGPPEPHASTHPARPSVRVTNHRVPFVVPHPLHRGAL